MKEEVLFKKTPFGGFDRESVINYIQQLKRTQQEYKKMLTDKDDSIKKLAAENTVLKNRIENAEVALKEVSDTLARAEEYNEKLREENEAFHAEQEPGSLDKRVAEDTIEKCDKLVESAQNAADKLRKNAQSKVKKAAKKLEKVKDDPEKAVKVIQELVQELK